MRIQVTFNMFSANWVKLPDSDAMAPRRFRAVLGRDADGAEYELDVELDDQGHSHCRELIVRGDVPSRISTSMLLCHATAAAAGVGTYQPGPGDGTWGISGSTGKEAKAAESRQFGRTPSRRRDSPDLSTAAKAWEESGGNIEAVQGVLHVSPQTAYRYVRDARDRGLLRS